MLSLTSSPTKKEIEKLPCLIVLFYNSGSLSLYPLLDMENCGAIRLQFKPIFKNLLVFFFSFLLLMLKEALQEANAQLEGEFFSEVISVAIVFQQRGDDIAQGQMRKLEDSMAQANDLDGRLDRR